MLCACGMRHADCVTKTASGRGITGETINGWLQKAGYRSALVVADVNTEPVAQTVMRELTGVKALLFVYAEKALVPDETAVGRLLIAADAAAAPGGGYEVLLAVGSGTVNDLVRYVSHRLGLPYYIIATAASMDGYASSVAPLIVNGLKLTYPASAPLGIIGDTAFIETAPPGMTAAGYGDVAGKWTSVNDWELEHIVTGGAYCAVLADEMRAVASACAECGPDDGDKILRALVDSGLVMQRAGHSKPASGSEHHLSHFWEMQALLRGRVPALHGAKVGVAVLAALRVNEWLLRQSPDWAAERAASAFDRVRWAAEIHQAFGRAADGVLAQWPEEDVPARERMLESIRIHWDDVRDAIRRNIPPRQQVEAGLRRIGCPVTPGQINVDKDDFINGVLHAQRIRPRFTVWRIADALGLLPEYAERLWEEMS